MSRVWESLRKAEAKRSEDTWRGDERSASDRRSSARRKLETGILVCGLGPDRRAFRERAQTLNASNTGCLLELDAPVALSQRLFLTHVENQNEQACRVVHVGRRAHGRVLVGVVFPRPTEEFWAAAGA
jgi:PilZ domain